MSQRAHGLLLVHAHPDDETITTGATMAHYAALGVPVTLVTCTLGERGEILLPRLAGLDADRADQLGGYRVAELDAATRALGVEDHRFLGGAGRFRDSGMAGSAANEHPRAFWRAADDVAVFEAAVALLVGVIREVQPAVVVTYDPDGDYGHPDHVMAHRVTTEAVARAAAGGGDRWPVSRLFWTVTLADELDEDAREVTTTGVGWQAVPAAGHPHGADRSAVTVSVDATGQLAVKTAALRAHATQVLVREGFYALSNLIGRRIRAVEHFRLAFGDAPPDGWGGDLFAGLETMAP